MHDRGNCLSNNVSSVCLWRECQYDKNQPYMWRLEEGEGKMHKYQTPSYRCIGRIFNCTKMVKDEK